MKKLEDTLSKKVSELSQEISGHEKVLSEILGYLDEYRLEDLNKKLAALLNEKERLLDEERKLREEEKRLSYLVERYRELEEKRRRLEKLLQEKEKLEEEVKQERKIKKARELKPIFEELRIREREQARLSDEMSRYRARFNKLQVEKEKAIERLSLYEKSFSQKREQAEDLRDEIEEYERILEGSQPLVERRIRVFEAIERIEQEVKELREELEKRRKEFFHLESIIEEKKATLQETEERLLELKKNQLMWLAYQIASHLKDGDTCPVCGGKFHGEAKAVDFDREYFEKLEKEKAILESKLGVLEERRRNLSASIEEVEKALAHKEQILNELVEEKGTIEKELDRIGYKEGMERIIRERRRIVEELEKECRALSEKVASEKARIEQLDEQIRNILSEMETKKESLDASRRELERLKEDFMKRLKDTGLNSEEFEILVREEPRNVESALKAVETEICLLERDVKSLEEKGLNPEIVKEYERVLGQQDEVKRKLSELNREEGRVRHIIEEVKTKEKKGKELEVKLLELKKRLEEFGLLKRLLFRKDEFYSYFTEKVLEAVLKRTNSYLEVLTDGRFKMDFVSSKGFVIYDRGIERLASGLSGGESSLIAISLAMSLAEVASGRLDAFFIDEGFSSLDVENKAKVASVLKELKKLNKVIVLITHDREFSNAFERRLRIEEGVVVSNE
ncbi:MAG: SMC family ATPase [Thermotoga sp.]|nr:SMC family ATPase [Thermotoga sp.]